MNRADIGRGLFALFGAMMLTRNLLRLRSGFAALAAVLAIIGAAVLVISLASLVQPDGEVYGITFIDGDQPTWLLLVLGFGTAAYAFGTLLAL